MRHNSSFTKSHFQSGGGSAATTTSAVSFTTTAPTSLVANTASVWTLNFTGSSAGALAAGGYIVATFPSGFTTSSTSPAVVLTTPSTFPTTCTATGSDPTKTNVVVINLANNGTNTCALANSTAAALNVGVVNGPAGTDTAASFSLYTSKDGTTASPSAGATIASAGPPGSGTNWTLVASSPVRNAMVTWCP